jgi:hypothetical protein
LRFRKEAQLRLLADQTKTHPACQPSSKPLRSEGRSSVSCSAATGGAANSIIHSHTDHPPWPKAGTWLGHVLCMSRACLVQGGSRIPSKDGGFGLIGGPLRPLVLKPDLFTSTTGGPFWHTLWHTGRLQENEMRRARKAAGKVHASGRLLLWPVVTLLASRPPSVFRISASPVLCTIRPLPQLVGQPHPSPRFSLAL